MKHIGHINCGVLALLLFLTSCDYQQPERTIQSNNDHLINAVLYHQTAPEYRALCYQTYNIAGIMLDQSLEDTSIQKPRALVVDIDETLLDNTPYEAKCIIDNISYPELWKEWLESSQCSAIPGALDFLNYADSSGVKIMYVTNRREKFHDATIRNLDNAGFPQVKSEQLFMRTGDRNSKEERRKRISENYHICLLIGDNIHDFTDVFEGKSIVEKLTLSDSLKQEFGRRFLILPNPIYGSWDAALFEGQENISDQDKYNIRLKNLKSF